MSEQRIGEATAEPSKRGHVTAVDLADADVLLDIVARVGGGSSGHKGRASAVARFLADKREEWLLCAMTRAEQTFKVKRRDGT